MRYRGNKNKIIIDTKLTKVVGYNKEVLRRKILSSKTEKFSIKMGHNKN